LTAMVSMTVALGAAESPAKMTVIGDWRIAVEAAASARNSPLSRGKR
jgi:hypothetical protein